MPTVVNPRSLVPGCHVIDGTAAIRGIHPLLYLCVHASQTHGVDLVTAVSLGICLWWWTHRLVRPRHCWFLSRPTIIQEESDGTARSRIISDMTGVPAGTLRYWRHSNIGPASFTLGRRVVYRRDEVLRWISQRESATRRGGGDAAWGALHMRKTTGPSRGLSLNHPIAQHGSSPSVPVHGRPQKHRGQDNP